MAKLRTKLGAEPLTVLAAATASSLCPAVRFDSATVTSAVVTLADGVLRMVWIKKLVAAAVIVVGIGGTTVGVRGTLTAGDPPRDPTTKGRGDVEESQAVRVSLMGVKVQMIEAEAALKRLREEEARLIAQREALDLKMRKNGAVEVTVRRDQNGKDVFWCRELRSDGVLLLATETVSSAALGRHLKRVHADLDGPKSVSLIAEETAHYDAVAEAVRESRVAGYSGGRVSIHVRANVGLMYADKGATSDDFEHYVVNDFAIVDVRTRLRK